ncbi:MAG TPA: STN domain-containing protein [Verrucomicrobiae bacterium]
MNRILPLVLLSGALFVAAANASSNDWQRLWQPNKAAPPDPIKVRIGSLGDDLGRDLENQEWLMIPTRHHELLFQDSADRKKVAELWRLLDGLYVFLDGRSPAKPPTPIRAFLVPKERGRSRCSRASLAMRTGELGDLPFVLTSLLHEETHLFNFAFLGERAQSWWPGEFCCIYFQERALLEHEGRDLKQELKSRLPRGPVGPLAELDRHGKSAFDDALAAQFFLEEKYGKERLDEFRRRSLVASKASNGGRLPEDIFQQVFGKNPAILNVEWRAFQGWGGDGGGGKTAGTDSRLERKVTYSTEKDSVQDIVQKLAAQVGLGYDFEKSKKQTDPLCRRWVNNVAIENKPCREALDAILTPVGLRYEIDGEAIVLFRK